MAYMLYYYGCDLIQEPTMNPPQPFLSSCFEHAYLILRDNLDNVGADKWQASTYHPGGGLAKNT